MLKANDVYTSEMIDKIRQILLDNEWEPLPGRNIFNIQKDVCLLISGLNKPQFNECSVPYRGKIEQSARILIGRAFQSMKRIDLGCGVRKKAGYLGVDEMRFHGVDVVTDLTKDKLPFEDNTVDAVYTDHFFEHLDIESIGRLMDEIHRVCKNESLVEIRVPHFSGFTNFYEYHKTSFRLNSFAEYLWEEGMFMSPSKLRLVSRKICLVNRQSPKNRAVTRWFIWNHPMEWLVNKFPRVYEMSGWRNIFPAWEIIWKMKVVK